MKTGTRHELRDDASGNTRKQELEPVRKKHRTWHSECLRCCDSSLSNAATAENGERLAQVEDANL
jgi:hypothetical protein